MDRNRPQDGWRRSSPTCENRGVTAFAILLAGPVVPTRRLVALMKGRRVIAADGGIAHASALEVVPELWVGDFDSASKDALAQFAHVPRQRLPREKDRTDGEAATDEARRRGATDLLFLGALRGARTDHAMTNLALAVALAEAGLNVRLADGIEEGMPLGPEPLWIDLPPGTPFSILAFSDLAGLRIAGARWPLDDVDVAFGTTRTQSNEALGPVEASCRSGRAVLLANLDAAEPGEASA